MIYWHKYYVHGIGAARGRQSSRLRKLTPTLLAEAGSFYWRIIMSIIETNHFLDRWEERVGRYRPRVHKLIQRSIRRGENRILGGRLDRGMLIPLVWKGRPLCVVGVPEDGEFILRSVLTEDQADRIGWNRK